MFSVKKVYWAGVQLSPSSRTGVTTGCSWLELKDETETSVEEDVADEDEEEEDDMTASLGTELSITEGSGTVVLLTTATVLLPRTWALMSKSSPSSSSST